MAIKQVDAYTTNRNTGLSKAALTGKPYVTSSTSPWVRNPSWPTISAASGSNKIVGLYAVFPGDGVGNGGNFFAVTISGNYTIDYGDGTVTNYTSGSTANYEFNYNSAALANTDAPVTFTASTSVVNRTSHGYTNGMTVRFYNIVTTTGISENTDYYVINATTNTFQVSATSGGSAITLTNDGSAKLLPYKTAVVTITPQDGSSITSINFNVKHSTTGLQAYSTGWLDIAIAVSTLTSITLGTGTPAVYQNYLEQVKINQTGAVTSFSYLFSNCYDLESVYIDDVASNSVTNMASMFNNCYSLTSVPLFNTAAVTNMQSMFSGCYSLVSVPLFNTAAVTTMAGMFGNCYSLVSVPLFNTAAVTTMASMFSGCYSLTSVPRFNTAAVTNMASMFLNCYSLTTVPLFNTAAVTSMANMLNTCRALTSIPALVTTAVVNSTGFAGMLDNCTSLTRIQAKNFRFTFSVANCKLSAAALDEIYTNLPTVTGQTITVSSNYGTISDTPSIATAKGWTVSG